MTDNDAEFEDEEFDWEKEKERMAAEEKARKEAEKKLYYLCHDFYKKIGSDRAVGVFMVPIKRGDYAFYAGGGYAGRVKDDFDWKTVVEILNEMRWDGFWHDTYGRIHTWDWEMQNSRNSVHVRDGHPALLNSDDLNEGRKSVWDSKLFTMHEEGKMKRIKCIGGCMSVKVVDYKTAGFDGSESILEIVREWMMPDNRQEWPRFKIIAPVHHFEQTHVLTGFIHKISMSGMRIRLFIEADKMMETGHYH